MANCCSVGETGGKAPAVTACPVSGTRAKQVDSLTVKSLLRHIPFAMPRAQYYFCDAPGCDVVYFSNYPNAPVFRLDDLLVPVGVKETRDPIPLCYCFGVTRQQIKEEIQRTAHSTAPERIKAEVQAGNCACEVKNPSGKCCLGDVNGTEQEVLRIMQVAAVARYPFANDARLNPKGKKIRE